MNKKIILKYTILILCLIAISFVFILLRGKKYTFVLTSNAYKSTDTVEIELINNNGVFEVEDYKISDGLLVINIKSLKKGNDGLDIRTDNKYDFFRLYIDSFGVIHNENPLGDTRGDEVIPISISILLFAIIGDLIKKYKRLLKENLYQYKNIAYLSIIIFLWFVFFDNVTHIVNYNGFASSLNRLITSVNGWSLILLPIAIVTFILVTISNIKLMIKEGYSIRNMLGILLGIFLCLFTILPDFMYRFTYSGFLVGIHQYGSVDYYIYNFVEFFVFSVVAYLECVLISTIVLSLKAAKRIPAFNKDYIIILGCMVNDDGSLPNLLKSRVDRALEFRNMQLKETKKDLTFICSGGKGDDEPISEGEAIKRYLIKNGIKAKNIIVEDKSTSTYENMKFSNKLIKDNKNIAYSTTNFHVFRAGIEASSLGMKVEGIGAKTKAYFWINAFIREFIATLYSEKKRHILVFSIIMILTIVLFIIMYQYKV